MIAKNISLTSVSVKDSMITRLSVGYIDQRTPIGK